MSPFLYDMTTRHEDVQVLIYFLLVPKKVGTLPSIHCRKEQLSSFLPFKISEDFFLIYAEFF